VISFQVLWFTEETAFTQCVSFYLYGVRELRSANAVGEQEVSMFSGLERQARKALCREKSVAWAWIEARGVMNRQPTPSHTKLTTSVLLNADYGDQVASWRDSLAAVACRELARQICEQFYDLSLFSAWRGRTVQPVATSRMLSPALPSYCRQAQPAEAETSRQDRAGKSRLLTSVLGEQPKQSAVLIPMRSKAA
jgi:hypothetical protein